MRKKLFIFLFAFVALIGQQANASTAISDASAVYSESTFDYVDANSGGFGFCFDGNNSSYWRLLNVTSGDWGQVQYDNAHYLTDYTLNYIGGYRPNSFKIQGSNDGSTWLDIDIRSGVYADNGQNYTVNTPGCYKYYRIDYITAETSAHIFPYTIEFNEDAAHDCSETTPPEPDYGTTTLLSLDDVTPDVFGLVTSSIEAFYIGVWPQFLVVVIAIGFILAVNKLFNKIVQTDE